MPNNFDTSFSIEAFNSVKDQNVVGTEIRPCVSTIEDSQTFVSEALEGQDPEFYSVYVRISVDPDFVPGYAIADCKTMEAAIAFRELIDNLLLNK